MDCLTPYQVVDFVEGQLGELPREHIDSHIDSCADCRELVGAMAHTNTRLGPGSIVGHYKVEEVLGSGAMATVYSAMDSRLQREVALKVLHEPGPLLREAQAMAKLSHPNVVTVFEVGEHREHLYLAMEKVRGQTLRSWLQGAPPMKKRLRVLAQVAKGLQAAHDAQVVHRDLKPENILVSDSIDELIVKVSDFGLAHHPLTTHLAETSIAASDAPLDQELFLTQTGVLLGTPLYMAPEQLSGERATPASDQYSFCLCAFEVLEGRRAFASQTLSELQEKIQAESAPALSAHPELSSSLREAIARGLNRDPGDRHKDLRRILEELEERPSASLPRYALLGTALIAAAALAHLWLANPSSVPAAVCGGAEQLFDEAIVGDPSDSAFVRDETQVFRKQWIAEHTQTCRATRVTGEQSVAQMEMRMSCLQGVRDRFANHLRVARNAAGSNARSNLGAELLFEDPPDPRDCRDLRDLEEMGAPLPAVADEVRQLDGRLDELSAQAVITDLQEAQNSARDAIEKAESLAYQPTIARAYLLLARILRQQGVLDEAALALENSIASAISAKADRLAARAWIEAVALRGELGHYEEALSAAKLASANLQRLPDSERLEAQLLNHQGTVLYRMDLLAEARVALERSHQLRVGEWGVEHPLVARTHSSLGNLERESGDYAAALGHHRASLAINRNAFGEDHPRVAHNLHNIAGVLRVQERFDEAVDNYLLALEIRQRHYGQNHPLVALTLNSLGLTRFNQGQWKDSEGYYRQAIAAFGDNDHGQRVLSQHGLASALVAQDRFREAEQELYVITRSGGDDRDPQQQKALLLLAEVQIAKQDYTAAQASLERILRWDSSIYRDEAQALLSQTSQSTQVSRAKSQAKVEETKATSMETVEPEQVDKTVEKAGQPKYSSSPSWD